MPQTQGDSPVHLALAQHQRDATQVQHLMLDLLAAVGSMRKHCKQQYNGLVVTGATARQS